MGSLQADSTSASADPRVDELARRFGPALLRLARTFLSSEALAQEAVQETWLAVLEGLDRFRGESSLKTWVFSILANRARSHAKAEGRSLPFSALGNEESGGLEESSFTWTGHWSREATPSPWPQQAAPQKTAEDQLLLQEELAVAKGALDRLPSGQRAVVLLRDVEGVSSQEACNVLDLTETNQRVLLHRGRLAVRRALEQHHRRK
jgi:RNA polymerase sigma-70 factor (ECF subfamily)